MLPQDCVGVLVQGWHQATALCRPPRVVAMPKLERRRQARFHPRICRRPLVEGGSAPSEGPQGLSGGVLGNRTVQRVLVL